MVFFFYSLLASVTSLTTISFHRQFTAYTGGHQKVLDYLQHSLAYTGLTCDLYVDNRNEKSNIFTGLYGINYQNKYNPVSADIVFLAGVDWKAYASFFNSKQKKINLIQHLRHADPTSEQFYHLQHRAIRICVSKVVRDAIAPFANGPCLHIPMGHDFPEISPFDNKVDIYIQAKKRPGVGKKIAEWASNNHLTYILHDELQSKENVLRAMSSAYLSVLLPNRTEGFYLPGIEAALYSQRVLMTDCIANAEYANISEGFSVCDYSLTSIIAKLEKIFEEPNRDNSFLSSGVVKNSIKKRYCLLSERENFHKILSEIESGTL